MELIEVDGIGKMLQLGHPLDPLRHSFQQWRILSKPKCKLTAEEVIEDMPPLGIAFAS